jgi:fluoride exporter
MSHPPAYRVVLVVAAGGVLGALARYGIQSAFPRTSHEWPWPVLLINVAGGLAIGLLMGWLERADAPSPYLRPFAGAGILGGFTTQSTSSLDGYHLFDAGRPVAAACYLALTLAGALLATMAGLALAGGAQLPGTEPELDDGDVA